MISISKQVLRNRIWTTATGRTWPKHSYHIFFLLVLEAVHHPAQVPVFSQWSCQEDTAPPTSRGSECWRTCTQLNWRRVPGRPVLYRMGATSLQVWKSCYGLQYPTGKSPGVYALGGTAGPGGPGTKWELYSGGASEFGSDEFKWQL